MACRICISRIKAPPPAARVAGYAGHSTLGTPPPARAGWRVRLPGPAFIEQTPAP
jgi:hypothetical protein